VAGSLVQRDYGVRDPFRASLSSALASNAYSVPNYRCHLPCCRYDLIPRFYTHDHHSLSSLSTNFAGYSRTRAGMLLPMIAKQATHGHGSMHYSSVGMSSNLELLILAPSLCVSTLIVFQWVS